MTIVARAIQRISGAAEGLIRRDALRAFLSRQDDSAVGGDSPAARADGLDQPWLATAVGAISDAVARTPWVLTTADDQRIIGGDLHEILTRPNERQDWADLVQQVCLNLLTIGAAAIIKDYGPPLGPNSVSRVPLRLIVADPARLTPVWSSTDRSLTPTIDSWEYQTPTETGMGNPGGGRTVRLAPEDVITLRRADRLGWHPLRGMSPVQTLATSVAIGREADAYVADYLGSRCNPTAEFATDQRLTRDQTRQLTESYIRQFRGPRSRPKISILTSGLKRVPVPALGEIAMRDVREGVRQTLMGVFGVPPLAAGIVDNANRSNSDAQMAMLLTGPVMTLADRINSAINTQLVATHPWTIVTDTQESDERHATTLRLTRSSFERRRAGKASQTALLRRRRSLAAGLDLIKAGVSSSRRAAMAPSADIYFDIDVDSSPIIGRLRLELLPLLMPVTDKGVAVNDILDFLDIALDRRPSGDVARVSIAVAPAEAVDDVHGVPAQEPSPTATPDSGSSGGNQPTEQDVDRSASSGCAHGVGGSAAIHKYGAARAVALRAIRERIVRAWLPIATELTRRDTARIRKQGEGVIARARAELAPVWPTDPSTPRAAASRDVPATALQRVLFDLDEEQGRVSALVRPFGEAARDLGATQAAKEAGLTADEAKAIISVVTEDPNLTRALASMQAEFRLIERQRWDDVRGTIRSAFEQGKTFDQLIDDLTSYYSGSRAAAKRAAVTEVGGVLGEARHEGFKAAGVSAKSWLTTSPVPRPTHAAAEEQYGADPIPIDEPFVVGGAAMRFPADPQGPPGERINCYCVLLAAEIASDAPGSAAAAPPAHGLNGHAPARRTRAMRRLDSIDDLLARYADLDIPCAEDVIPHLFDHTPEDRT